MSLTPEERDLMDKRDTLTVKEREVVSDTFHDMRINAKMNGDIPLANDDRAARLEAALVRYILESRE